jgi:hypothetical protein
MRTKRSFRMAANAYGSAGLIYRKEIQRDREMSFAGLLMEN